MGWERDFCADCGTEIPKASFTQSSSGRRVDRPMRCYTVSRNGSRVRICAACFVTARIPENINNLRSVSVSG